MADPRVVPPPRGDEAELYRAFNHELMSTVARNTKSEMQTVEDACAFAWAQFLEYQPDRERNWEGWLFRTAQRQVWLLERDDHDHLSFPRVEREYGTGLDDSAFIDHLQVREDVDEAFAVLRRLPERLQRIAMLRALGMRYSEIGEMTGDSATRVHQLVKRANARIDDILETRRSEQPQSPRAGLLQELEQQPPAWLTDKIGKMPGHVRADPGESAARRAWRRAALALNDFLQAAGTEALAKFDSAEPSNPALKALHGRASRAVEELRECRELARGCSR